MSTDLKEIIKQFKSIPTGVISDSMDALGLTNGWLLGLKKRTGNVGETYVGQVKIVQRAANTSKSKKPHNIYEIMRQREENETILLISGPGPDKSAATVLGDNTAVAAGVAGFEAIIADGAVRDSETLDESGIGIFSVGREGRHGDSSYIAYDVPIMFRDRWIVPGDIVAADIDGAIVFPADEAADILRHAQRIEELEEEQLDIIKREGSIDDLVDVFRRKSNPEVKHV